MPETAYIGVGSNLKNPKIQCKEAIYKLDLLFGVSVKKRSSFYETEPMGSRDQNWFINAVVKIETSLSPSDLLEAMLEIETKMGRIRKKKWGPRIIDLDLLFFGDRTIWQQELKIPHPELQNRIFVLVPLCEINPDILHPRLRKTSLQMLEELSPHSTIRKVVTLA
tara:strand:+ start:1513 stop:2010 length:498 start_codon:yes stop_codon:yes gene_type:complete